MSLLQDPYILGFFILALILTVCETVFPKIRSPKSPTQRWMDLLYQVLNYKWAGPLADFILIAAFSSISYSSSDDHISGILEIPNIWRFIFFLVALDFLEYLIHNLLHRVPFLWEFHKVHHSIPKLDWWGNLHFHPMEVLVYKFFLYLPLLLLNPIFPMEWMIYLVMIRLGVGMLAHSNLNISLGPLNYLINTPTLHQWHHAKGPEAINKNLGVTFTLWDFIFKTALYPKDIPLPKEGLGFPKSEEFASPLTQFLGPFKAVFKFSKK